MYGVQIAFKNYDPTKGFLGSPWAGLYWFKEFFNSFYFWRLIRNTIGISLYSLFVAFPIPIFLALLINEIKSTKFKKVVQNVTYIPHFISVVAIVGMLIIFLSPDTGIINILIQHLTGKSVPFMTSSSWFKSVFVFSNVWQEMGWDAIIYIAALSAIDPALYEAAQMDGASRWARLWHVSIPGILPIITILLILHMGHIMEVGFEKILLMQNPLNMSSSDVIATYVFRNGIQLGEYSYTAAIGLFNAVINFILLIAINWFAKKKTENSLW